ncbi:MAG: hypothetical protein JW940_09435 [Polyangiaceae bacterium]|nr:hypothetical protein [Polyangiaceae bacterium]
MSIGAAAAKLWVLWAMDTDDSRLMLTSTDRAGKTSLYALPLAKGPHWPEVHVRSAAQPCRWRAFGGVGNGRRQAGRLGLAGAIGSANPGWAHEACAAATTPEWRRGSTRSSANAPV